MQQPKLIDFTAALSYVAGGGFAAAAVATSSAFPAYSSKILAYSSIAIALAGLLLRLFFNKTAAPATSIVADAPVVTPVTHSPTDATVVSTSSTVFEPKAGSAGKSAG
jgi:hypothetical protein